MGRSEFSATQFYAMFPARFVNKISEMTHEGKDESRMATVTATFVLKYREAVIRDSDCRNFKHYLI